MAYANLHIGLYLWDKDRYTVNLSFTRSGSDADTRAETVGLPMSNFARERFLECASDMEAYGAMLGRCLLAEPKVTKVFYTALAEAEGLGVPLRVQLVISLHMPDLHDLHWELLRDPADGRPLFVREDVLFSRYLNSEDTRPVRLRNRGELSALVVIANPTNLAEYRLAPIDVDREVDRVNQELGSFDVTLLSSVGPASLNGIIEALRSREGGYDILYLVCHGACVEGEPRLWLEKANGQAAIVSGVTLADRLAELTDRPRLVILASCESAGTGDDAGASVDGALAAIGPRLARAGIPAVVAMQGRVTMATLGEFFPEFFRTLRGEGQIDLAMARARSGIQDRRDSWMPVLFMRSNTGRLWAQPGLRPLEGETSAFESWEGILDHIENGQCTPILGSGLTDELFGTHQEIARRWADLFRYPLADHDRVDLPQVAQFLATTLSPVNARNELKAYLHRELLERFGDKVPNLRRDGELWNLIAEVGRWRRQLDPAEPHRVLAGLRCPVYLTTNPDRLLVDALKEEGVEPLQRMFDWRSPNPIADPLPDEGEEPWPNASHPLVYHLFGSYMPQPKTKKPDPRGLVLSQDDYFQHLIAMVRNKTVIPTPVSEALTNSSLMFVGFQLNDWTFRILLQVIREREGSCALEEYCHVAVQVDPEAGEFQDPEMARRYLEKIGKFNERVAIYWGSSADFLKELQSRRAKRHQTVGSLV